MRIDKCWSKTKNLCKPYIERCEKSSRGLNWIAISTWTFLCSQVSDSCRKPGSWHGTVRALQHRQKSKYSYLHFENTMCMCLLTTNKVRELWQKPIFQQEARMKYSTVGKSSFMCIWQLSYLRKQRAAVRERELRGGSTTALMALYWQLFPGEPQHRANGHGEKIMPEKVHWVSPVPEADKLPQSSGSPAKERGTDVEW